MVSVFILIMIALLINKILGQATISLLDYSFIVSLILTWYIVSCYLVKILPDSRKQTTK